MSDLIEEMKTKGYVTPEEASKLSKVPQSTIYAWIRDGVLGEPLRHGRRRLFISLDKLREVAGAAMDPAAEEATA